MSWHDLLLRLRALAHRRGVESDLDEELNFHLEMEARKNEAAGMAAGEARRHARIGFNGVKRVREECRDVRGLAPLENLARDIRYGVRMLRKTPVFTAIAILSLALGIGANTAIFSIMNAVMLRALPVNRPEQLTLFNYGLKGNTRSLRRMSSGYGRTSLPYATYEALRTDARSFSGVFAFVPLGFNNHSLTVNIGGRATVAGGEMVSGNYFSVLGVSPVLGRAIVDGDLKPDAPNAAVISYPYWSREFGEERSAVGRSIVLNGVPFTVVGVAPPEFFGVDPSLATDIWAPLREIQGLSPWGVKPRGERYRFHDKAWWWCMMMGRLQPGVTEPQARAEANVLFQRSIAGQVQPSARPEDVPHIALSPAGHGMENLRVALSKPLRVLMIAVSLVLLIACANVATLLLARGRSRQKEMGVKLAMGASRARLVRQLLIESVLLSLGGGAAGLLVARWAGHGLLALMSARDPGLAVDARLDATVMAFTVGVSTLTGILFGLAPAFRATRVELASQLKESAGAASGRLTLARVLIAAQVAFSFLLLFGAGLFIRTLRNLEHQDLGFNRDHVLLFELNPGREGEQASAIYMEALEKIRALPGVRSATFSAFEFLSGWVASSPLSADAAPLPPGRPNMMLWNMVGPDFFETMGMRMTLGRGIARRDMERHNAAVVNEALVRYYFPNGNPLGRHFSLSGKYDLANAYEIVGVVENAKYDRMRAEPPKTAYVPYGPLGSSVGRMCFEVRTAGDPLNMAEAVRGAVREIGPALPLIDLKTQSRVIDESLSQERMFATVSGLFGVLALVLVAVGVYGTLAYSVTRRTGEIGIRMALGARRAGVLWMVLRESLAVVVCGLAIGVPAALGVTRLAASLLFGVTAYDGAMIAVTVVVLAAVGAAAGFLPAERASRVEPMRALRYE